MIRLALLLAFLSLHSPSLAQMLVDEVNPFIGTSFAAHNFPGAIVPWGMVSVSPHNTLNDPSGYYWDASKPLLGFGHVHLSGVGCYDLANIALMPTTGAIETERDSFASRMTGQTASPGYYSCRIVRYGVRASMTATERAGLSRYVFSAADTAANVLIDVTQGVGPSFGASVRIVGADEVEGHNTSGGFCGATNRQDVYFVARFSRRARWTSTWSDTILSDAPTATGTSIGAAMRFTVARGDSILVKVGISYTSIENARRNLEEEIPDWSFDRVHMRARELWERELSRIRVSGGTPEQRVVFHTAVYHSLIHPNLFNDVSGDYRRMGDRGIGSVDGYERYTIYSLWDSFRTVHPLLSMVWPERQRDMTRTMVEMVRENGWLPKWELAGMDANSMNGDPAAIVIADTWARGVHDFDLETAFVGMLRGATDTSLDNRVRPGLAPYIVHGYIPSNHWTGHYVYGPTSTSLEYHVADDAIARVAATLCRSEELERFRARSRGYVRLFDETLRTFRPRDDAGWWMVPFNDLEEDRQFTEGSAHHYRYYVPHDMPELIALHGGDRAFVDSLQWFFDQGRFMWNEHNLSYPWLFTFVDGESWRTHATVRTLMQSFANQPVGHLTNEDAGAISAWYVLSAIGLFPVVYGTDEWQLGSPIFDTVAITPSTPGARTFVITATGTSSSVKYIAGATLDGRPLHRPQVRSGEIAAGGRLSLTLGSRPTQWGRMLRPPVPGSARMLTDGERSRATMTCQPPADAVVIRLQVSDDATFCTVLRDTMVAAVDTTMLVDLGGTNRNVWWRVAAVDALGAEAWSDAMAIESEAARRSEPRPEVAITILELTPELAIVRCLAPDDAAATLVVYDALGREVRRVEIDECSDEPLVVRLGAEALPRGTYFCRLLGGGAAVATRLFVEL